jgi:hypothetical protein
MLQNGTVAVLPEFDVPWFCNPVRHSTIEQLRITALSQASCRSDNQKVEGASKLKKRKGITSSCLLVVRFQHDAGGGRFVESCAAIDIKIQPLRFVALFHLFSNDPP